MGPALSFTWLIEAGVLCRRNATVEMLNSGFTRTLLIGTALSAALSFQALAQGDGEIVLTRDVHPYAFGNPPMRPDPNPTTVNADASGRIIGLTSRGELSDGDFAGVNSGNTVRNALMPDGSTLRGLSNSSNGSLPGGMGALQGGSSAGTGGVAGQVNRSVQQGMGALNVLTRGQ